MGVNKIFCVDNLLEFFKFIGTLILTDGERPAGWISVFARQEVEPGFTVETHLNAAAGFMRHLSTSRKSLGSVRQADDSQVLKRFQSERSATGRLFYKMFSRKLGLNFYFILEYNERFDIKAPFKAGDKPKIWLTSRPPYHMLS